MKRNCNRSLVVMGVAFAFATWHALAADRTPSGRDQASESSRSTVESGRYGSPSDYVPYDYEIRLRSDTKSVNVRRLDIVRFVSTDGREFFWRFDTLRPEAFALTRIAPAGVAVPASTTVYVREEIPVAP